MDAPGTLVKRPREDPLLKQLAARLSATPADELAAVLSALPGGNQALLALLPAVRTDAQVTELEKAAREVAKKAKCRYSTSNAFSLGRARGAIAAMKAAYRKQAALISASKDANAIAAWATAAIEIAKESHWFEYGLTDYQDVCAGIAGEFFRDILV